MKLLYWIAPFYTLFIAYSSLTSTSIVQEAPFEHFDKVLHACAYAFMFIAWYIFFYHRFLERQQHFEYSLQTILQTWSRVIAIAAMALAFLIGIILEVFQWLWSGGRQMDPLDALANLTGIIIAAIAMHLISKKKS